MQNYGKPQHRQHAVQIEIDRALYMNERTLEPNSEFEAFRSLLERVIRQIVDLGQPVQSTVAAE